MQYRCMLQLCAVWMCTVQYGSCTVTCALVCRTTSEGLSAPVEDAKRAAGHETGMPTLHRDHKALEGHGVPLTEEYGIGSLYSTVPFHLSWYGHDSRV